MGFSMLAGPLMGLAGNAISSGISGAKGGGGNVTGGVSPQQAALAEYEGQQRKIADAAKFSSGMGASTMHTFADAAADINTAKNFAGMSDTTAAQQSQLQQLAQQAGLGPASGSFGNTGTTGGSTDTSGGTSNTTPDVSTG
jgi:hypothetical protein